MIFVEILNVALDALDGVRQVHFEFTHRAREVILLLGLARLYKSPQQLDLI